jgi:ferredoxin-type protein NapH
MLVIIMAFLLQFFRIKVLVGGLSGSVAVMFVNLIDIYAYMESLIASRHFTTHALISLFPVIGIYLIFGRAFCGWVCPMDFLFELLNRTKHWTQKRVNPVRNSKGELLSNGVKVSTNIGYMVAGIFLVLSGALGIPLFTNYISHLTNFFRIISGSVFFALDFPFNPAVLYFSLSIIFLLLFLEIISPKLWCRVLCPVGKTYGILNKVSLLRLKFAEGDCGECNLCEQVCYMDVKIAPYLDRKSLRDTNCIYCGMWHKGENCEDDVTAFLK